MSTIDERVVAMRFDNKQFESAANQSLTTLQKLSQVIDKSTTADNVGKIASSIDGINFGNAVSGVESLADRFSALGIVGKRVLENITDTLMGKFSSAISSVTGSIVSGGIKRAMNIENAHFQLQGLIDDEKEVQAIMADAQDSVDGTAYAYDSAANAASMFAATGLKSGKEMQNALRAIAGVAATTNSDYDGLAQIFTTVAGQGKVMADQLNQLAVRGMNAAAALTNYFNGVNKGSIEATDSVKKQIKEVTKGAQITEADLRKLVSKGQISFQMFSEGMSTTFGDHAKDANETFSGAMANIRAALARTGAMFITPLIGQNGEAVQLFNAIRVKINEINKQLAPLAENVTKVANRIIGSLAKVIKNIKIDPNWHKALTNGFFIVWRAAYNLLQYLKPIKEAFKEVFGGTLTKPLAEFRQNLLHTMMSFKTSDSTLKNLKDGFKGIFDIIKLGAELFVRLLKAISPTLKATDGLGSSANNLFGTIGRGLSTFAEWVRNSEALEKVFSIISNVASNAGSAVKWFIDKLKSFSGVNLSGFEGLGDKFKGFSSVLDSLKSGGLKVLEGLWKIIRPLTNGLKNLAKELWNVLTSINPLEALIAFINGKFLHGITKSFAGIAESLSSAFSNVLVSIAGAITGILDSLENADKMIALLKSVATSVLMLAGACLILASIDADGMDRAVKALKSLMTSLMIAYVVMQKIQSISNIFSRNEFKLFDNSTEINIAPILALAAAVGILAVSCKLLGSMDTDQLAKGMIAVTVLLAEVVGVTKIIEKTGTDKQIAKVGGALLAMSASILILVKAVRDLGSMDLATLSKGITSIGVLMLEMAAFTKFTDGKNTSKVGFALIEMAVALRILVGAVSQLGSMNLEQLAKGLGAMAIALTEMVVAINLMPEKGAVKNAFAMIEMALAMVLIAKALEPLAQLNPEKLLDAVVSMGILLIAIAGQFKLLETAKGTVKNAFAMIEMAGALWLIAQALEPLANVNPERLAAAVVAMGSVLFEMSAILKWGMPESGAIGDAFAMIEFAAALWLIAQALEPLASANPVGLGAAVVAMGVVLAAMTVCMNKAQPGISNLGALAYIEIAAALWLVAQALMPLTTVSFEQLGSAVLALSAVLAVMTVCLLALGELGPIALIGGAAAVLIGITLELVADSLMRMTKVMEVIKELKPSEFSEEIDDFSVCLLKLGGVAAILGTIGPLIVAGGTSLGAAGVALGVGVSVLAPALSKLATAIQDLNDMDSENFQKNAGPLAAALAKLGLGLKTFGLTSVIGGAALVEVAIGVKKLVEPMARFTSLDPDKLSIAFNKVALGIAEFGLALKAFGPLSIIGASSLNTIADAIEKLAPALRELAKVNGDKLQSTMQNLAVGFAEFGVSLKAFGLFSGIGANALVNLATAVEKLAPALQTLAGIEGDKIEPIMREIAKGFKTFGEAIEATPFWGAKGRSEAIVNLCDGVTKLAETLPKIAELPYDVFSTKLPKIGEAFQAFGTAIENAPLFNSGDRASAIVQLCDGIKNLADGIKYFAENTTDINIQGVLEPIGKAFQTFGIAIEAAPLFNSADRASAIIQLCVALKNLADGLKYYKEQMGSCKDLQGILEPIGQAFNIFGSSIESAPLFNSADRATGISTLVDSLKNLAEGLKYFSENVDRDATRSLRPISDAFVTFGTAIESAPLFNSADRATGITSLVNSIKTLVDGIKGLSEIEGINVTDVMGSIGDAFVDFGSAIKATPFWGTGDRTDAVVTVVNSLDALVAAVERMSEADAKGTVIDSISTGLVNLGNALSDNWSDVDEDTIACLQNVINAISSMSTLDGDALAGVNSAMTDMVKWMTSMDTLDAGSIESVTATFENLATTGIQSFQNAFSTADTSGIAQGFISSLSQSFAGQQETLTMSGSMAAQSWCRGLGNATPQVQASATTLVNQLTAAMQTAANSMLNMGVLVVSTWLDGIRGQFGVANGVGMSLGNQVLNALKSLESAFMQAGGADAEGFLGGIRNKYGDANSAGVTLGNQVLVAVQGLHDAFFEAGDQAANGFIEGIYGPDDKRNLRRAAEAGSALGRAAYEAARAELQIHSPSRKFRFLGDMSTSAFIDSLLSKVKDVKAAGASLGMSSFDGLKSAIDNIYDYVDEYLNVDPTIRPRVDMSEIQKATEETANLFNQAIGVTAARASRVSTFMSRSSESNSGEIQNGSKSTSGNTYNFIQNNNSPKALSRIDIYRQTRNQFTQFKEATDNT